MVFHEGGDVRNNGREFYIVFELHNLPEVTQGQPTIRQLIFTPRGVWGRNVWPQEGLWER